MRAFLAGFAFAIGLWMSPAQAQYAVNCPTQDTVVLTTGSALVISNCRISTGLNSTVFVTATGQVTCGAQSDVELNLVAGVITQPPKGASFTGSISGGVLTVASMTTPAPYIIEAGENLYDSTSGTGIPSGINGSTLTVTGQLSGTAGGVGTYSVSDNTVTVGSEPMWAIQTYAPLDKPPNSIQIARDPLENSACQNGKTYTVSFSGATTNLIGPPGMINVWVVLMITAESIGGLNPQSASWKNGQITMFSPGTFGGWVK